MSEAKTDAARIAELEEALRQIQCYSCPACSGDCGSANPPVIMCPMREIDAALSSARSLSGKDGLSPGQAQATRSRPSEPDDTARLDWLERHVVNVRIPLRYGSRDLFWANPPDEDEAPGLPTLREQIDAALAQPAPSSDGGER